ncbi:MAG: gluconokinase [Pseudomonadota bacterium]
MSAPCELMICMGVSGSGKTTLARTLCALTGFRFFDADDYHSQANTALMQRGIPLTNAQRAPWMQKVCAALADAKLNGQHSVLAHSALQAQHRAQLRALGFNTRFIFLDGNRTTIAARIQQRAGHFMPARLLDSQYQTLQCPTGEPDVLRLDIALSTQQMVASLTDARLLAQCPAQFAAALADCATASSPG